MAGHNKWSQIKHKKAVTDSRRSKLFTRILKEITVAARLGGGDPAGNPRLRNAITEARSANMPNDNIERAIKKGTGELEGVSFEELSYEGYASGGVALFVEAVSDNRNRTVSEIRNLFSKNGGSLGETGCVGWMFDRRGLFLFERDTMDEETFLELATELEPEDFAVEDGGYQIVTSLEQYQAVRDELEDRDDLAIAVKEIAMIPQNTIRVDDDEETEVLQLIELLEEHDDVQNVWSNLEQTDSEGATA